MICKQGNVDGLCGLYALTNFLVHRKVFEGEPFEQGREAFRYLLESAEELGMLSAHRIHDGFEWPLLREIFNHWAIRYEEPYRAYSLSSVANLDRAPSNESVISRIVEEDGGAVLSVKRGRHWVLVVSKIRDDGRFDVIDADWEKPEQPRKIFDYISCGVAIVANSSALKKALDVQKN